MFGFEGVFGAGALHEFGGEAGDVSEDEVFAFGEGVADAKAPVIGEAYDVAGECFFGHFAVLGEEHLRGVDGLHFAGADVFELHAPFEFSGADAGEGHAVAVFRVHVGLDFEDEGGDFWLDGFDHAALRFLWARVWGVEAYAA